MVHTSALSTVSPFGLEITNTDLDTATQLIIDAAESEQRMSIGFVNAHMVNLVSLGKTNHKVLANFDHLFGDGAGIALAARLSGSSLVDNVNGTDLFPVLCEHLEQTNSSVFFFGAKPGVAQAAAANTRTKFNIKVAGTADGYSYDDEQVIAKINESGANILLVGMGMPIQEEWIVRNMSPLKPMVVIAVGGLLDFVSGNARRAPKPIRKLRLEWVWRLANEPRRLFSRYVIGVPRFLMLLGRRRHTGLDVANS